MPAQAVRESDQAVRKSGQAVCVLLGSTSTTIRMTYVKKMARMVHTAGWYPFLAEIQAASTTGTIQSTSPISISGHPIIGTVPSPSSTAGLRWQRTPCRTPL